MKSLLTLFVPRLISARPATTFDQAQDILAKSREAYSKLKTYSDQGTVVEQSDNIFNRARFRTFRRQPKDFYYEYGWRTSTGSGGTISIGGHLVFWMKNGDLETWDEVGKMHRSYPAGSSNQITPIAGGYSSTHGALPLIASFLFPKATILNDVAEIATLSYAGMENIGGHKCHKLVGIAQSHYPSGQTFNTRPVAIWIDADTYLLRQFFTDTPRNRGAGEIYRVTITVNPVPNPTLSDANFTYKVPST